MAEISIRKAALINFAAKYSYVFINILYSSILARLLTPEDFGVVAVISVFISFFYIFTDMGIGTAIVQNKQLTKADNDNIFSFSFYVAIILAIFFSLFSFGIAGFYNNTVYKPLGSLLSLSLFFSTLNMVPNAMLLKEKRFKLIGIRLIAVTVVTCIMTIIMALCGFKYYALVLNSIISTGTTFLWNMKSVKLRIRLHFNMKSVHKIRNYSSFIFFFSIMNYFSRNLDNLFIGKVMGDVSLAYYDKAYKLMLYPVGNLANVITPILHPILSDHQDNKPYILAQYIKVARFLSLLGAFISAFCFFEAKDIMLLMFGKQWLFAVPCFRILALSIWAQMITAGVGSIFQSLGKSNLLFYCGIISSAITVAFILIGISFRDLTMIALFITIAYNMHFFIGHFVMMKFGFGFKSREFFLKLLPHVGVFAITFAALYAASFLTIDNFLLSLIIKGVISGAAYLAGLIIFRQYSQLFFILKRRG